MITGYFGLPGCGKSTFKTMLARKYIRKGYTVYTLSDSPVKGSYIIDWEDIGRYDLSNSVLFIDEISLYADSRDFKKFNQILKKAFILHRHYHMDIYWFTQQWDGVDRKIREMTPRLYYIRKFGELSYAITIKRFIFIDKEQHAIQTGYKKSNSILAFIGKVFFVRALQFCYRPLYYKYFDSFEAPELPHKDYPLYM